MYRSWLVLAVVGCSGTPATPPTPAPAPVVAPAPMPPEAPAAPAAPEATRPADGALAVVVDAHRQLAEGRPDPKNPVTVKATAGKDRVDLVVDHLMSYCAPAPSFGAVVKADALEVTLLRPTEPVSRCFGTHHVEAHVDLPAQSQVRKVIVLNPDGRPIVEALVTSAP